MSEETGTELTINVKGPSELKLQIAITSDKTVLELKQAIAAKSDVEADRQRLIYSGRVLKDEDVLSVYKIQSSHTIHMVKGVAKPSASGTSSAPSAAQPLPTMAAGQSPLDPLTALNTPAGYGALAGMNPFADMGLNPNDPNMLQGMLNNPAFLQQMSSVMSNPGVLDQIISSNPQLQAMGPQVREVFQSDRFRELMSNPDSLRMMFQMSQMMQGVNSPSGSAGSFPAPGVPSNANAPPAQTAQTTPGSPGALPPLPPLGNMFGAGGGTGGGFGGFDPAMMQQMQQLFGGGGGAGAGAGAGGFGGFGGGFGGAPATPADTRPPEERFEVQLQQLNDMGFTNPTQNVRALQATAGNVHSAIEYILNGGGL